MLANKLGVGAYVLFKANWELGRISTMIFRFDSALACNLLDGYCNRALVSLTSGPKGCSADFRVVWPAPQKLAKLEAVGLGGVSPHAV